MFLALCHAKEPPDDLRFLWSATSQEDRKRIEDENYRFTVNPHKYAKLQVPEIRRLVTMEPFKNNYFGIMNNVFFDLIEKAMGLESRHIANLVCREASNAMDEDCQLESESLDELFDIWKQRDLSGIEIRLRRHLFDFKKRDREIPVFLRDVHVTITKLLVLCNLSENVPRWIAACQCGDPLLHEDLLRLHRACSRMVATFARNNVVDVNIIKNSVVEMKSLDDRRLLRHLAHDVLGHIVFAEKVDMWKETQMFEETHLTADFVDEVLDADSCRTPEDFLRACRCPFGGQRCDDTEIVDVPILDISMFTENDGRDSTLRRHESPQGEPLFETAVLSDRPLLLNLTFRKGSV